MAELAIYKANALTTLFVMIIFSLFGASFFSWVGVGIAYFHGALKWPTAENRKVAPWGLVDILMTLMAIVFLQVLFAGAALTLGLESIDNLRDRSSPKAEAMGADEAHFPLIAQIQGELEVPSKLAETTDEGEIQEASAAPPKPNHPSMQYAAFVQTSGIVCMLLMTAWIALRCQVAWDQIGWSLRHWRKDFSLAMGATVLFVPTVYVLMAIVSSGMGKDYSHPIFEMVGKNAWLLLFAVWMAVIVAPFTEEFFFRVLLQGYLEAMAAGPVTLKEILFGRAPMPALVAGAASTEPTEAIGLVAESGGNGIARVLEGSNLQPASSLHDAAEAHTSAIERGALLQVPNIVRHGRLAWWPLCITGPLFGLAHFEYGMSWVPLTFLGLLLGFLYRMTHRIWPCLFVHMFVNSLAMLGLAAKVLSEAS